MPEGCAVKSELTDYGLSLLTLIVFSLSLPSLSPVQQHELFLMCQVLLTYVDHRREVGVLPHRLLCGFPPSPTSKTSLSVLAVCFQVTLHVLPSEPKQSFRVVCVPSLGESTLLEKMGRARNSMGHKGCL